VIMHSHETPSRKHHPIDDANSCATEANSEQIKSNRHRGAHSWVDRLVQDAANIASLCNLEVTLVAPSVAPGILDQPIAFSRVVADSKNTMVEVGAAILRQNATSVVLERALIGLNGNGHWANVNGRLELCHCRLREQASNTLVSSHATLGDGSGEGGLARAVRSRVWIRGLSGNILFLGPRESSSHAATIAAHGGLVTVDKLLL